jgi:LETM1-like protein.
MHSMHTGLRRRHRLAERAAVIHEMDMAIIREGGVSQLSQEELRLVTDDDNIKLTDVVVSSCFIFTLSFVET